MTIKMAQCKECNLYDHNLREDGLCTGCYMYLTNPPTESMDVGNLFETVENYTEHMRAIFHYHGMCHEGIGPVKEYAHHLSEYIKDNNIPDVIVYRFIDIYHNMYGC